jgi:hypothetical protein
MRPCRLWRRSQTCSKSRITNRTTTGGKTHLKYAVAVKRSINIAFGRLIHNALVQIHMWREGPMRVAITIGVGWIEIANKPANAVYLGGGGSDTYAI